MVESMIRSFVMIDRDYNPPEMLGTMVIMLSGRIYKFSLVYSRIHTHKHIHTQTLHQELDKVHSKNFLSNLVDLLD